MDESKKVSICLQIQEFPNGMSVKDLKKLVANLPEVNESGEDNEAWMMTGNGTTSQIANVSPLNRGDILFGCRQWPV